MRKNYWGMLAATLVLAGCSADPSGPPTGPPSGPPSGPPLGAGLTLSAPVPPAAPAGSGAGTVVFVSVAPGTVARAASAQIRANNAPAGAVAVVDGGFDPVAVPGVAGDEIGVTVTDSAGTATTVTGTAEIRARPRVVRTSPAPRKTDVPLNAIMRVVFSAPMTPQTVLDGVRLTKAGTAVAATVVASDASGLVFDLQPLAALEPGVDYAIEIAAAVKDVNGTTLGEVVTATFTTAPLAIGSIRVITKTSGESIDPDGYSAWVPVPPYPRSIGISDTLLVPDVPAGDHSIILDKVSVNCLVDDGKYHGVQVTAGATTTVFFAVRCLRGSQLNVVTSTSGSDLDPDGYAFALYNQDMQGVDGSSGSLPVATNGNYVFTDVLPGTYSLVLYGVSPNCSHDRVNFPGYHEPVTMAGADVTATFVVNCLPVRQLAAVAGDGANAEIYLINSNGVGSTRLTSNAALDDDPAWSPDGSRIVFSSERDGNREIYVMNADGSGAARLTNAAGKDSRPAWSPDGSRIAFVSDRDGNAEVYLMNADGTSPVRLTSGTGEDLDPTWSPDGRRIAFSSGRNGSALLYVMNADGTGQVQVTFSQAGLVGALQPAWSPDGATIAFVGQQLGVYGEAQRILHRVAPDGSSEGFLSSAESLDGVSDPAWSADGRQITATSGYYPTTGGIMTFRAADGAMTGAIYELPFGSTGGFHARNAAWRP